MKVLTLGLTKSREVLIYDAGVHVRDFSWDEKTVMFTWREARDVARWILEHAPDEPMPEVEAQIK